MGTRTGAEVVAIKSSDILPYQKALEGFREELKPEKMEEFSIDESLEKGKRALGQLEGREIEIIFAIGPEAAFLVKDHPISSRKLFAVVLNPEKILGAGSSLSGVAINIPPRFQLEQMARAFPDRRKVAVFYTPGETRVWVDDAALEARSLGLELMAFPVSSPQEIPQVFRSESFKPDVFWFVPDKTIVSQKVVELIAKECLRRKIPFVGFNPWFAKNGAVLSFAVDYKRVGKQAGRLARRLATAGETAPALVEPPEKVSVIVNWKMARKIQVLISPEFLAGADEVVR
jgi:putative ABC transport system substrate-binding protein